jgi:hypothetical protein
MVQLREVSKDVGRRDRVCRDRSIGLTREPAVFVQWPSSNAPSAKTFGIVDRKKRDRGGRYDDRIRGADRHHPGAALGCRHFDPPLVASSTICRCLGHSAVSWGYLHRRRSARLVFGVGAITR